jgi:hypothetical protein
MGNVKVVIPKSIPSQPKTGKPAPKDGKTIPKLINPTIPKK